VKRVNAVVIADRDEAHRGQSYRLIKD